jgi:cytochrome c biogenesis protein CcmG/thiol:disulfide interchange protein DsbE
MNIEKPNKLGNRIWQVTIAALVVVLLWFLWQSLFMQPATVVVDSQQGQSFPEFTLAKVNDPNQMVTLQNLKGKPHLVHIFASWCGVCIDEYPIWTTISKKFPYPIVGIVYRDEIEPVKDLLEKKGDPFVYVLNDVDGKLGIDLGLMGVPVTYVLDAKGNIRMHQLGALSLAQFEADFAPLLETLSKEA